MTNDLLVRGLTRVLAGTLVLRCKVRFFGWSLRAPDKSDLGCVFRKDYELLDRMCDDLADRIADLGGAVPGSYSRLLHLSSVGEDDVRSADQMVFKLWEGHRQIGQDIGFLLRIAHQDVDCDTNAMLRNLQGWHEDIARDFAGLLSGGTDTIH